MTATTYGKQFAASLMLYFVILVASLCGLKFIATDSIWKYPVAFTPAVPILLLLWVIFRYIKQQDELQRLIQFKAVVSAFCISGFAFTTYGFLQNTGLPTLDIIWAFPLMIWIWGLSGVWFQWKYRA
jgi:hypothetical protein